MSEQDGSSEQDQQDRQDRPEPEPRLPEPELQAVKAARYAPEAEADPDDPGVN
jgi:hypothetical protein